MTTSEQLTDLQSKRENMLQLLSSWSADQLKQQPAEGGWCALEVVDHIITSERGTLGYMLKKTSSGWEDLEDAEAQHNAASRQLNEALISPGRWSAPAVLPPPDPSLNLEGLAQIWVKTGSSLENFAKSLPAESETKLVFKHPIAGRFTLGQTLEFLRYHIDHHLHQLDRIKNSINS